jgi:hypothetical protein
MEMGMSGIYQDQNGQPGVPGGRLESEAAVREGVAQAYAATAQTQREAAAFIVEHGSQVLGGHTPVNKPGRQGDPDPQLDPADS